MHADSEPLIAFANLFDERRGMDVVYEFNIPDSAYCDYSDDTVRVSCEEVVERLWKSLPEAKQFSVLLPEKLVNIVPVGKQRRWALHFRVLQAHGLDYLRNQRQELIQRLEYASEKDGPFLREMLEALDGFSRAPCPPTIEKEIYIGGDWKLALEFERVKPSPVALWGRRQLESLCGEREKSVLLK
jgi:hypothetical protein